MSKLKQDVEIVDRRLNVNAAKAFIAKRKKYNDLYEQSKLETDEEKSRYLLLASMSEYKIDLSKEEEYLFDKIDVEIDTISFLYKTKAKDSSLAFFMFALMPKAELDPNGEYYLREESVPDAVKAYAIMRGKTERQVWTMYKDLVKNGAINSYSKGCEWIKIYPF